MVQRCCWLLQRAIWDRPPIAKIQQRGAPLMHFRHFPAARCISTLVTRLLLHARWQLPLLQPQPDFLELFIHISLSLPPDCLLTQHTGRRRPFLLPFIRIVNPAFLHI